MAVNGAYWVAAAAATYGAAEQQDAGRKADNSRAKIKTDKVKAETEAAQKASAQTQMARKALRANSLFTGGGDSGVGANRTTLGV